MGFRCGCCTVSGVVETYECGMNKAEHIGGDIGREMGKSVYQLATLGTIAIGATLAVVSFVPTAAVVPAAAVVTTALLTSAGGSKVEKSTG